MDLLHRRLTQEVNQEVNHLLHRRLTTCCTRAHVAQEVNHFVA
jgi:hypothetical protein